MGEGEVRRWVLNGVGGTLAGASRGKAWARVVDLIKVYAATHAQPSRCAKHTLVYAICRPRCC